MTIQKVVRELEDVVPPLAQWRNPDIHAAQPEEQIRSEEASFDQ